MYIFAAAAAAIIIGIMETFLLSAITSIVHLIFG
jgi:hypothetical protein